jgi:heptosyltransferase-2
VRGVNWLGDAVMTTPALLRLREHFPDARITLLTHEKLAELWWKHPAVDSVISFAKDEPLLRVARQLRGEGFDLGIALPNSPRTALELWLARIPVRVGVARPWRNFLLTHAVPPRADEVPMHKRSPDEVRHLLAAAPRPSPPAVPPGAHHIHQYLHLVAALGAKAEPLAPHIAVTDAEVEAMRKRFGAQAGRPLLGLNAGAEYGPAKRWPPQDFAATAIEIQKRTGASVWVFGGLGEKEFAESIAEKIRAAAPEHLENVRVLAGQTTLRELCAALRACDALVTNDTGPTHLAAAVGTRVVAIYGSTSPELTAPGLPSDCAILTGAATPPPARHLLLKSDVPCAPCFLRECPVDLRCMKSIRVATTVAAVLRVLETNGAEPA